MLRDRCRDGNNNRRPRASIAATTIRQRPDLHQACLNAVVILSALKHGGGQPALTPAARSAPNRASFPGRGGRGARHDLAWHARYWRPRGDRRGAGWLVL